MNDGFGHRRNTKTIKMTMHTFYFPSSFPKGPVIPSIENILAGQSELLVVLLVKQRTVLP